MLDAAYVLYQTLAVSLPTVVDAMAGRLTPELTDLRMRRWADKVLARLDVRLEVRGRDGVDWSRAYVIMSNHQSHIDIPVVCATVPGSLRFVAKRELFGIPVFGRAIRDAGMIRVDRQNREKAIAGLREAQAIIRAGTHVWIAPEGTRSRDGQLGPLKKGGFLLAMETDTPILPVAIQGTREVLPPHGRSFRHGVTVRVTFGSAVEVAGVDRDVLVRDVQAFLQRELSSDPP